MNTPHSTTLSASPVDPECRRTLLEIRFAGQGPLLGGRDLWSTLGYPSAESFRQAKHRRRLPVEVFHIDGRTGVFAYTEDIIDWLAKLGGGDATQVISTHGRQTDTEATM